MEILRAFGAGFMVALRMFVGLFLFVLGLPFVAVGFAVGFAIAAFRDGVGLFDSVQRWVLGNIAIAYTVRIDTEGGDDGRG